MDVQTTIPGWGVDKEMASRPGYPLEQERHVDHDTLQGQSPWRPTIRERALSGAIRRLAYGIATHKPRRWMLLMLADRVDGLERKFTPRNLLLMAGALGGVAAIFVAKKRMR